MDDITAIRTSTTSPAVGPPSVRRVRPREFRPRLAALAAVALIVLLAPSCSHDANKATGTPLPDAKLTDLVTGKAADWPTGKPLVVNFWASWCTPCRAEMPAFDKVAARMGDKVTIIGVTDEDDHAASKKAAKAAGVSYPLLVDTDQVLMSSVGITNLPGTVFVDEDGTIIGRHFGALTEGQLTKEIEKRYGITE